MTYPEIAWTVMHPFFCEGLSHSSFQRIIDRVCTIPIPLSEYEDRTIVELFHGPTMAFKDIGATWMAALLGEYQQEADQDLHVLVATSGDTGGAVAAAFYQIEGIRVTILYPQNRVSLFQEQQMAGLGGNIRAIAVDGTFDDCQSLVKTAFQDQDLRRCLRMTSANSINIARWIPQCLPYIEAIRQSRIHQEPCTFVVPCGNLGNLSAGLLAQALGLPVSNWVASSNANDCFVRYLQNGIWSPKPTVHTLASAMDVGLPNNMERIHYLNGSTWNHSKDRIKGLSVSDKEIASTILQVFQQYGLKIDPHTATAWYALDKVVHHVGARPMIMGTAHSSKFDETIHSILGLPHYKAAEIKYAANKRKTMMNDFAWFKEMLLSEP